MTMYIDQVGLVAMVTCMTAATG